MDITLYWLAQRYVGTKEIMGVVDNPIIMAMLKLDGDWPQHDEVPWCGAAMNWWAWHLRLPRSKDWRARSWLRVGTVISLAEARVGFDVVILKRGTGDQPGPEVIDAPGHVALFSGLDDPRIWTLGGNQSDMVKVSSYPVDRLLGVRRLYG